MPTRVATSDLDDCTDANAFSRSSNAAVTSDKGGLGVLKPLLLVIAATIRRPFAILSVTERFFRFNLTLAIRFSSSARLHLIGAVERLAIRREHPGTAGYQAGPAR